MGILACLAPVPPHVLADEVDAEGFDVPDPRAPDSPDGPVFPISHFVLQYQEDSAGLPAAEEILPMPVELGVTETGYAAPREGLPTELVVVSADDEGTPRLYHASAIGAISAQLLAGFQARGLIGVYVAPHENDVDLASERDLRRRGDTILRLVVTTGRVKEMRTLAGGDRVRDGWVVDNKIHDRIRERSPIQPTSAVTEGTTDLLVKDVLEDYIFQLNRHPGRQVEAALSVSTDGKGVALDYRVNEAKPWFVYYQGSNTGTEQTAKWQNRIGFVNRQLFGRDDIFSIEYMNAGISDVHAVRGYYEAPWFGSKRPSWYESGSGGLPGWPRAAGRDNWPWFGTDRLRWSLGGGWSRFTARAVDFTDDFKSEDWSVDGRLTYTAFQHRALFLDVFGGGRVRDVEVENEALATKARSYLFLPEVGLRLDRVNEYSTVLANIWLEANVGGLDEQEANLFGRADPDDRWQVLRWDVGLSHFLEPVFNPSGFRDPSTRWSSTLAHEVALGLRGQYAFDYRLIPQASQVIGGLYSVRGYPQSAAVGDSIYVGSFEYRFHIPRSLPLRREPMRVPLIGDFRVAPQQVYGRADWDLIFRAFVDYGRSVRNDPPSVPPGSTDLEPNQSLVGAGVGLELLFRNNFRGRVDWGVALKDSKGIDRVKAGNSEFNFLISVLY